MSKEKSLWFSYWELIRMPTFLIFWSGRIISQLGDMLFSMATMWYVLGLTNSALSTALIVAIPMFTSLIVFQPFATLTDRLPKKAVMVSSDAFRAIISIMIAFLIITHHANTVYIYIAILLLTLAGYFFGPAQNAVFPSMIPEPERLLPIANSLLSATGGIISLLGFAIGGVVVAFLGSTYAIILDGISFLLSALSLAILPIPMLRSKGQKGVWGFVKDSLIGIKFIWNRPTIRVFGLFVALINFVSGPVAIFTVIFSKSVLNAGVSGYGYLESAFAIGGVFGAIISTWSSKKFRLWQLMLIALVGSGVALVSMPITKSLVESIVALAVASVVITVLNIPIMTALQLLAPPELRGRIMAAFGIFAGIGQPLGLLVGSFLIGAKGASFVFMVSGILMILCGILSLAFPIIRGSQNELESNKALEV